jgi:predicted aconitase with swiveling domain
MHTANTGIRLVTRTRAPSAVVNARVKPIVACAAIDRRLTTGNGRGVLMPLESGK